MKILGVVGSRRKKGNTFHLVNEALKPFIELGIDNQLIFLGDHEINACTGCEGCRETYRCVIRDDMQKLYPLILESDAVVLGSPAYFYNVSADMKVFIDRCYCLEAFDEDDRSIWMGLNEALGGKYAAVVAVCEQQSEEDMGYTATVMEKSLAALGYRVICTVKALNCFAAGEVLESKNAMKAAREAGEKLLKTLQLRSRVRKRLSYD